MAPWARPLLRQGRRRLQAHRAQPIMYFLIKLIRLVFSALPNSLTIAAAESNRIDPGENSNQENQSEKTAHK
jgi:hypothetical protein